MEFRDLRADEIEARIGMIKSNGLTLLLYKNARTDMDILDETVGNENWQRDHKEVKGNMYCGISIWDDTKKQWITKWDCGTESNTEKEKGESSDSFKRAGVNWGIGRELYTSPFIWIKSDLCNLKDGKCYDKFKVTHIEIEDKQIVDLKIVNSTTGVECFKWHIQDNNEYIKEEKITKNQADILYKVLIDSGLSDEEIKKTLQKGYGTSEISQLTNIQYGNILNNLNK